MTRRRGPGLALAAGLGLAVAGVVLVLGPGDAPVDAAVRAGASDGASAGDGVRVARPEPAAPDGQPTPAPAVPPGTAVAAPAPAPAPSVPLLRPVVRVDLPTVGVTAVAEPVTTDAGGVLLPPEQPATVGWWAEGSWPTAPAGTVVVVGHVDTDRGDLGVFSPIADLALGAEVSVTMDDGTVAPYVVRDSVSYASDALPAELFARDGPRRLALVTCTPPYDERLGRYARTLVVWAEPLS